MGELATKKEFVTPPTEYPLTALARKTDYENMIRAQQGKTLASLRRKEDRIKIQIGTTDLLNMSDLCDLLSY